MVDVIPPHIQQQIAETNAANIRALRAHEKMVAELRRQIIAMNQDMIETKQTFRLRESELQAEINQAQELNSNLMEENESFQLLLHEKSINGEFMQTSIMKVKKGGQGGDDLAFSCSVVTRLTAHLTWFIPFSNIPRGIVGIEHQL